MASRYEVNTNDPACELRNADGWALAAKFTAWKLPIVTPMIEGPGPLMGSYGMNNTGLILLDPRVSRGPQGGPDPCPRIPRRRLLFDAVVQTSDSPPGLRRAVGRLQ